VRRCHRARGVRPDRLGWSADPRRTARRRRPGSTRTAPSGNVADTASIRTAGSTRFPLWTKATPTETGMTADDSRRRRRTEPLQRCHWSSGRDTAATSTAVCLSSSAWPYRDRVLTLSGLSPAPVPPVRLHRPRRDRRPVRLCRHRVWPSANRASISPCSPVDLVQHLGQHRHVAAFDPQHPLPRDRRHRQRQPAVAHDLRLLVRQPQRARGAYLTSPAATPCNPRTGAPPSATAAPAPTPATPPSGRRTLRQFRHDLPVLEDRRRPGGRVPRYPGRGRAARIAGPPARTSSGQVNAPS
jgi:hypothetical protein